MMEFDYSVLEQLVMKARWSVPGQVILSILKWIFLVLESLLKAAYRNFLPYAVQPKKDLNGQTVLITGAGGGIGHEIARKLAIEGCRLVLWDMNTVLNDQTAQICENLGAKVYCQKVDVTDRHAVYRAADEACQNFGQIDILINNAGLLNPLPFMEIEDDRMSTLVDVNVKALFWTAKAFVPRFIDQGHGHIVTMGSVASIFGAPSLVDYGASKFAAFGFMESLCYQLLEQGHTEIKFTTICPYYVKTPMIDKLSINDSRISFLDPDWVAERVIRAIRLEQRVLILPALMSFLYTLRGILPWNLFQSIVQGRRARFC
ncbi:Epidermal retinol dehydrogenase 2 [Aphelenchoides bicaudatus]|nr:Epidermal retinol dehydrogenase 2 [Aphelenchoides bicaudatus]